MDVIVRAAAGTRFSPDQFDGVPLEINGERIDHFTVNVSPDGTYATYTYDPGTVDIVWTHAKGEVAGSLRPTSWG